MPRQGPPAAPQLPGPSKRQAPTAGQVKPHDPVVGLQQRRVNRKVGGAAGPAGGAHIGTDGRRKGRGDAAEALLPPTIDEASSARCRACNGSPAPPGQHTRKARGRRVAAPAGVGLHVDAPLLWVKAESLQRPRLAQVLNLVYVLVAAIVARALCGQGRAGPGTRGRGAVKGVQGQRHGSFGSTAGLQVAHVQ